MSSKYQGLLNKYDVKRIDGKPIGECIVLEFGDPHGRVGIAAWATSVLNDGYERLAQDIAQKLREHTEVDKQTKR